jgi:hypothetical protein
MQRAKNAPDITTREEGCHQMKQHLLIQGVEVVTVGQTTLSEAQKRITGCAACSPLASHSLEWLLGYMLGSNGLTEYFLSMPVNCPDCSSPILEGTLINFDGKARAALEEDRYFDMRDENQDVVFVDESTLLEAQSIISGCEHCSELAEIPFDQVLDAITGCDPTTTEYVICHAAKCGCCQNDVMEKTLVIAS